MSSEPASTSKRAEARAQRRERRQAKLAQRESYFELLASGYSCRQIAEAAKVSASTVKRAIDQAIAERRLDAPDRYAHLQVARLNKALRLADASIERGELKAIEPYMRLIAARDRYHGFHPVSERSRKGSSAPPVELTAPPLALPAPPLALTSAAPSIDGGLPDDETVADDIDQTI
jgi:DNA-binding CsgD family transcriptional regulator